MGACVCVYVCAHGGLAPCVYVRVVCDMCKYCMCESGRTERYGHNRWIRNVSQRVTKKQGRWGISTFFPQSLERKKKKNHSTNFIERFGPHQEDPWIMSARVNQGWRQPLKNNPQQPFTSGSGCSNDWLQGCVMTQIDIYVQKKRHDGQNEDFGRTNELQKMGCSSCSCSRHSGCSQRTVPVTMGGFVARDKVADMT